MPTLSSLDALLDETTFGLLGDPLTFTADGQPPKAVRGFVDYGEHRVDFGTSSGTDQDIAVEVYVMDVPIKPNGRDRVALPKRPGINFSPKDVRLNDSGTSWLFRVKQERPDV